MTQGWWAFVGIAALLTVTPGADMALVTRSAVSAGRRPAFFTTLGICTGLLVWATVSALGLAGLLETSATAYDTLKLAGAAYLIGLGAVSLWRARRDPTALPEDAAPVSRRSVQAYRQGLLNNLLNPKIAVFYSSFLPQFVGPDDPVLATSLLLAAVHAVMGVAWLTGYAWALTQLGAVLRRPRVRRGLEAFTGTVLVGFGLRLALASRHPR